MGNVSPAGQVALLTRVDVERLLDLSSCMSAVEAAFRRRAIDGQVQTGILGLHVAGGGFHAKAAAMPAGDEGRFYFAAKLNANFPQNPRDGRPTIQGLLTLFDGATGTPLCVMDSIAVTILRTAAATGIAARYLAAPDARTATIIGCGAQAHAQLAAINIARPLTSAFVFDIDAARAREFAKVAATRLALSVEQVDELGPATLRSDIIVTCTPAHTPFLGLRHVSRGAFVAAVGADSENKSEIEPELMADAAVVVDNFDQCSAIGDLHHAIARGAMHARDVRAELADVIRDPSTGRRDRRERVVFDSTGVALQDVAAAALVYEAAIRGDVGHRFDFAGATN